MIHPASAPQNDAALQPADPPAAGERPAPPDDSTHEPLNPWPRDPEARRAREREVDALGDDIARLSAHLEAAAYRLLVMIRAFDHWRGWHRDGAKSCAQWLAWRTGITPGAARERVRVARALAELPALSEALSRGELSYSVARVLTRVATPDNEEELVELAGQVPASQVARLVRRWQASDRAIAKLVAEERERHQGRELWLTPAASGSWRIHGRLDPEAGAVLKKALEAAEEELYRTRKTEEMLAEEDAAAEAAREAPVPRRRRWADALGLVAEAALGEGLRTEAGGVVGRAERFQVVVRVAAETLAGIEEAGEAPEGAAAPGPAEAPEIDGGPDLFAGTARRLACDCSTVEMTRGSDGSVLDVGRKRRRPPTALRRALDARDRGCRFPGCGSRYCQSHHIVHWTRGGPTALENLALLCRRHHRFVHEGGWRMALDGADRTVRFIRPDGRELPPVPAPEAVPEDPVGALEREQRALGIDEWTATPDWDGGEMDVDFALEALAPPLPPRRAPTPDSLRRLRGGGPGIVSTALAGRRGTGDL